MKARQVQPLNVFDCPLQGTALIEASAGTGKTWNICGLVLRLLLERGLKVSQVLVVTFTKAATAELRERIRGRLGDVLEGLRGGLQDDPFVQGLLASLRRRPGHEDAETALRLHEALQGFDEAAIFTIHSFCQRALADAPFTAGVPLQLEALADDRELRLQAVQDFWRRRVACEDLSPPLARSLAAHHDHPDRWALLLKRRMAQPLASVLWPAALDTLPALDDGPLKQAHQQARALWLAQAAHIEQTLRAGLPALKANIYNPKAVDTALADWTQALANPSPGLAPGEKAALLGSVKLAASCKQKQVPPAHAFFDAAQALLEAHAHNAQATNLARLALLRQMLAETAQALRAAKESARVVAFDDMLFNLHQRLEGPQGPALAAALRERFPAALIDEFQDTDPLQFAVFQRLYGGAPTLASGQAAGPLCLVGDPKQAIYSFRGADLNTYLRARGQADAEYTLAENQRSVPALLEGLNALFGTHAQPFMQAGLDYPPVKAGAKPKPPLLDHSGQARAALQLWALPDNTAAHAACTSSDALTPGPWGKGLAQQRAAQACAAEISRLLAEGQAGRITLAGQALQGGDIAVLVRSHRQGRLVRQALSALGVASVELSQDSVFDSPDAAGLQLLLRALLQPTHEAGLRAALSTEAMGWTADRIAALNGDENATLAVVQQFQAWHALWLRRGVGRLMRQWLEEAGVPARLLKRPDGERRLTNLLHLAEVLQQAAREHASPEALLRWFEGQRGREGGGEEAQLRLESDRHLVQVVTIHKSKGLEYAFVFCPFLWDGHRSAVSLQGDGLAYPGDDGQPVLDFHPTPLAADAEQRIELAAAAEQLRLVYVALTRAVHRCYLVVGGYSQRADSTKQAAGALLNWLVAGGAHTPANWIESPPPLAEVMAAWAGLANRVNNRDAVALFALPTAAGLPLVAQRPPAASIQALPAPAGWPTPWWVGSYSGLVQAGQGSPGTGRAEHPHGLAVADHDGGTPLGRLPPAQAASALPARDPAAERRMPPEDILAFPRGATAGQCLHRVFELANFADATQWPSAINRALAEQPPQVSPGHAKLDDEVYQAPLQQMLQAVLNTRLPPGFTLAQTQPTRRLAELEFHLPAQHLADQRLNALLLAHGYRVPPLHYGTLQGYLRGFIDLVFEHDGRWYLLDWKSNHLGHTPAHYGAAPLAEAMASHAYTLQYLLYTVALHRWLQRRLPGYRYEQHLGGALYLFIRGVRPDWQQPDGTPCGVVFDRPPLACVEALSALLSPPPSAQPGPAAGPHPSPAPASPSNTT